MLVIGRAKRMKLGGADIFEHVQKTCACDPRSPVVSQRCLYGPTTGIRPVTDSCDCKGVYRSIHVYTHVHDDRLVSNQ